MIKQHKLGCLANVSCLVIHPDGVCPGPYGKCTCDSIKENTKNSYDKFVRQGRAAGFLDDQIDFMWDWISAAVEDPLLFSHPDNYAK